MRSSISIIRMMKLRGMRLTRHVACMREKSNAYRILVRTPQGKRTLGRPRHTLEDHIKMDVREIGWGGTDWIDLAQDKDQWRSLVNMVMNLQAP
jgi:hypothetical protein